MAESTNPAGQGRFRPLILTFLLTSLVWIVVLGGLLFLARRPEPATFEITAPPATATPVPTATATPTPTPSPLQVDVDGGVRQPGVYQLAFGSRVQDAIAAAGGLTDDADVRALSLARLLQDGEKLYVPAAGEELPILSRGATLSLDGPTGGDPPGQGFPVNINTATAAELEALPGIGPKTAQAIVDYRDANGPFPTLESIMEVKGIGEGTFEKLRDLIGVD